MRKPYSLDQKQQTRRKWWHPSQHPSIYQLGNHPEKPWPHLAMSRPSTVGRTVRCSAQVPIQSQTATKPGCRSKSNYLKKALKWRWVSLKVGPLYPRSRNRWNQKRQIGERDSTDDKKAMGDVGWLLAQSYYYWNWYRRHHRPQHALGTFWGINSSFSNDQPIYNWVS